MRQRAIRFGTAITGSATLLILAACSALTHSGASATPAASSLATSRTVTPVAASPAPARPRASPKAASVTITAVGDTMLGNTPDLPADPATYFNAVKPTLDSGAQIVFGNLEGTLTTSTTSKCGVQKGRTQTCFAFRDPPGYARYFKQAGFTILNDANNHSFDFGAAGQAQTVQAIHAAGLAQTGLPGEITLVKANGVRVAFLAFAPYDYDASLLDRPAAQALIKRAAREASIVVVYMHAGAEGPQADHVTSREEYYLGEDRGNAEAFAHMAINAGASLVIASGPHVLRGMQFYRGHLIAYSVGNFAGYDDFSTEGDLDMSVILHVTLSATGRFERARIYPIEFTGEGRPVPGGGAIAFVTQLAKEDFGSSAARIQPSGVISPPGAAG
jgi:poly-gamma-glutamate capsule biosynthesis protein CapA/YwtB (metallophosphatase superfamily)